MSILALAIRPKESAIETTPLLSHIAGEFALRIAALWPAPHEAFLTAARERRHLACLALALGRDLRGVRRALLEAPLRRVLKDLVPAAPAGLRRALGRLGDVAWSADDYRRLLVLLADPRGSKALRHAEGISRRVVRRLAILPPPMAGALYLAWELTDEAAAVVREAYEAIALRDGPAAAEALAARWARAETGKSLVAMAADDLCLELPPCPFAGTARLRPITSRAAIRETARRFDNCLADDLWRAASGDFVYFEWTGPPGAVVAVTRCHVFGWRLNEARGVRNAAVPAAVREEIMGELSLMGVHTGRTGFELERALRRALQPNFQLRPAHVAVAELFGEDD